MAEEFQFSLDDIRQAAAELRTVSRRTPLLPSLYYNALGYKAENLQLAGSFKIRPAYCQIARLSPSERARGIVTSSSGNFAQGAAYAARSFGIPAKIVMMQSSNPRKVEQTRAMGGLVVLCEDRFEARAETVERIAREEGRTVIHPYNHGNAVLGNASLGLEVLEQAPAVKHVVVPISGGGLIAGVLVAVRQLRPEIRVWGVQPEGSCASFLSLQQGRPVSIAQAQTIADGLKVTRPGSLTFPIISRWIEDIVTVAEDSIVEATRRLILDEKLVVEPSGAVTLAAILEGKIPKEDTVCVLSGGNIAPQLLLEILGSPGVLSPDPFCQG